MITIFVIRSKNGVMRTVNVNILSDDDAAVKFIFISYDTDIIA